MDYDIYSATNPNGEFVKMAICPGELEDKDVSGPEDFFVPDCTDFAKIGRINIVGDAHLLEGYFQVNN